MAREGAEWPTAATIGAGVVVADSERMCFIRRPDCCATDSVGELLPLELPGAVGEARSACGLGERRSGRLPARPAAARLIGGGGGVLVR